MLTAEGWRAERVYEWRQTAAHLRKAPDLAQHERGVAYLEAASALAPDDGVLSTQLGEAHWELYQEQTEALALMGGAADAAQIVAAPPGLACLSSWRLAATAREQWTAAQSRRFAREHTRAGLRRLIQARDACPLLSEPNLQLAIHIGALDDADARAEYLHRVKLLAPDDPGQWYLCGVQELFDGQSANAWQKSATLFLELCSNQYLSRISWPEPLRNPDAPHLVDQLLPERGTMVRGGRTSCSRTNRGGKAAAVAGKGLGPLADPTGAVERG